MARKAILAFSLLALTACATPHHGGKHIMDAAVTLQHRFAVSYMDAYSPLSDPVAIVQGSAVVFLSGPCAGLDAYRCPQITHIPELDAGRFLMRDPYKPGDYSFYGFESIDRTAGIIAHEEFHRWQHHGQEEAAGLHNASMTNEARPYAMPSEQQIAALLAEFSALKTAGSDNSAMNMACLAQAIVQREHAFEDAWNEQLSQLQTREGIARYIELIYRFAGDRAAMREYMQRELIFEGTFEGGDWNAVLRLFAYPMGGMKSLLILNIEDQLAPIDDLDQRIQQIASNNNVVCTRVMPDVPTQEHGRRIRENMIAFQQRLVDALSQLDTAYVYRTRAPLGTFSFSRHIRMAEGALLVDHVSILLRNGHKFIDEEAALIMLECTQNFDTFVTFRKIDSSEAWLLQTRNFDIEALQDVDRFIGLLCHQLRQTALD